MPELTPRQTPEIRLDPAERRLSAPGAARSGESSEAGSGEAGSGEVGSSEVGSSEVGSLLEAFEANVSAHPDRPLFCTKTAERWHELSYAGFAAQVDAVRAGLYRLGVEPGDRVAIIGKNSVAWAAVAYACYGLRAALVPMYETQLAREWEHILGDSGARVLFVADEAVWGRLAASRPAFPALAHVVVLDGERSAVSRDALSHAALMRSGEAKPRPALLPAPGTPAAFLYTSGTTGDPKGVVLTHGNLWSNVCALKHAALGSEQTQRHRTLSFLPWAHAFAHTVELHLVVATGASLAIAESIDKVADNLLEVRPTVLIAVPRVFIRIHAGVQQLLARRPRFVRWVFWRGIELARQRAAGRPLSRYERALLGLADRLVFAKIRARFGGRLQFAISGAALLPLEVASFVAALGITLCEGYGLTETSPIVTANVPGMSRLGSVGRPLPGVRVLIEPTSAAEPPSGEIVVYGPNVMAGYHNRERETRDAFTADGGFKTGDLGYLDPDGYLYITGRIKEQYKLTNGKYVAPAALEGALERTPFIAEAMVYGDGKPYNVALIVPKPEALLAWARERDASQIAGGLEVTPSSAGGRSVEAPASTGTLWSSLEEPSAEALCDDPIVRALIRAEIDRVNADRKGYERVRAFRLLPRSFSQEEGLLTPSLKLRRHKVVERFRAELEAMYLDAPDADLAAGDAALQREERLL